MKYDDQLSCWLEERLVATSATAAAAAFGGRSDHPDALLTAGRVGPDDSALPCGLGAMWDLASLTKVLMTTPAILRLVGEGRLGLDWPLGALVPALGGAPLGAVTVAELLTHTSGAPAELPRPVPAGELLPELTQLTLRNRGAVRYSDVGFIALGLVIEHITGEPLVRTARTQLGELTDPGSLAFGSADPSRTVWTGAAPGEVHDPVARAGGGLLGHAGLFATLEGTVRLLKGWLDDRWIVPELRVAAFKPHTRIEDGGLRGYGWSIHGDDHAWSAPPWPETTVSHSGFTGGGVLLDPPSGRWAVLLVNTVADPVATKMGVLREYASRAVRCGELGG